MMRTRAARKRGVQNGGQEERSQERSKKRNQKRKTEEVVPLITYSRRRVKITRLLFSFAHTSLYSGK